LVDKIFDKKNIGKGNPDVICLTYIQTVVRRFHFGKRN